MSDRESIEYDAMMDAMYEEIQFDEASEISALEQCIYLFVEGESEETALRIILEEELDINFKKYGVVIANYNGIGNLKHTLRLMRQTLSHKRPMIFTFDNDTDGQRIMSAMPKLEPNFIFFKIPELSVVKYGNNVEGGSFEEAFEKQDFITACFETTLLKENEHIKIHAFEKYFNPDLPWYKQIVTFLKDQGLSSYLPNKVEISECMALACEPIPNTFVKLGELIMRIRLENPVNVRI